MKESVGYYVTLNIIITFIVIVFTFIAFALIYFKSNKVGNIIVNSIEKYEGYNYISENEINTKLEGIGYGKKDISNSCLKKSEISDDNATCTLLSNTKGNGSNGYCIYECVEKENDNENNYYFYKIRTVMSLNIPIISNVINIPIYSDTNRMYYFSEK